MKLITSLSQQKNSEFMAQFCKKFIKKLELISTNSEISVLINRFKR